MAPRRATGKSVQRAEKKRVAGAPSRKRVRKLLKANGLVEGWMSRMQRQG